MNKKVKTRESRGDSRDVRASVVEPGHGRSPLLPEVLRAVFSRLDVRAKGRAAQVCTAWRDAVYQPALWCGVTADVSLDKPCPNLIPSLARRGIRRMRILTMSSGLRRMVREIGDLRCIDFGDCADAVTDRSLLRAFDHELPRLFELDLPWCDWITDQSAAAIGQHCINLTKLNLSYCRLLTDTAMMHIARGLPKLASLDLHGCRVTDAGIAHLAGVVPGVANGNLALEFLGLHDCTQLTDEAIRYVSEGLKRLTIIDLSGCSLVTEVGLGQLAKLTRLRELTYDCDAEDSWLFHFARLESGIVKLDLENCRNLTNEGIRHVARLTQLRVLNLCTCQGVTDDGLLFLAEEESKIVDLNLTSNFNLTDTALKDLSELTNLSTLDISHCRGVTDMGLRHLAEGTAVITSLNITGCISIGSRAFKHIARGPPPFAQLRCLVGNANHISAEGVTLAARHLHHLQTLLIDGRNLMDEIIRLRADNVYV